jgi:hypothetical protein
MITKEFARDQIKRLAGLDHYPSEKEAFNELVGALQSAENENRAKAAVDDLARNADCAKPGDIRRVLLAHSQGEYTRPAWDAGALCQRCQSIGYLTQGDVHVRCVCQNGVEFPQILLDSMNRPAQPGMSTERRVREVIRVDKILSQY